MLRLQNIRIVVVEDRSDVRLLIAEFLAKRGAVVFTAKNGFEGIRSVRENRPDIVLSDLSMPGMDGFELLANVRALGHSGGGDVPVIAMTGYGPSYGRKSH
jgi:CheY-like chemotaxis protein